MVQLQPLQMESQRGGLLCPKSHSQTPLTPFCKAPALSLHGGGRYHCHPPPHPAGEEGKHRVETTCFHQPLHTGRALQAVTFGGGCLCRGAKVGWYDGVGAGMLWGTQASQGADSRMGRAHELTHRLQHGQFHLPEFILLYPGLPHDFGAPFLGFL